MGRIVTQTCFTAKSLKLAGCVIGLSLLFAGFPAQSRGADTATTAAASSQPGREESASPAISADEAIQRLIVGNQRYVQNALTHPNATVQKRAQLAAGQHPFAIVLGCSDSRVPPEVVFDQGLGDLFVVRVAGNVLDDDVIGSLEYAVEHLHAPLILVLGHSNCGAVSAAVSGKPAPGHIEGIVKFLKPAVDSTRGLPGDPVTLAVDTNVRRVVGQLKSTDPILAGHFKGHTLQIIGGRYDLNTGAVELFR
jgi:carbonic anhydrase